MQTLRHHSSCRSQQRLQRCKLYELQSEIQQLQRLGQPWRHRGPHARPCAVAAAAADAATPSTSGSGSGGAGGGAPGPLVSAPAAAEPWTYKYRRARGPSPCRRGDAFCAQLDALLQNVLAYPHTPPRIHRRLEALRPAGIDAITERVEAAAAHYGAELALSFFSRAPELLLLEPAALAARGAAAAAAVGAAGAGEALLLHKNPQLLLLDTEELRARYEALPRALGLDPQQCQALVIKYPLVLSRRTHALQFMAGRLRGLAAVREQWRSDVDAISPSLMAQFLRDFGDQVRRLEYLASTGESPGIMLREVMKPSNRRFAATHPGFRAWSHAVAQRRQQQAALAARAAARAEAAGGGGGGGGAGGGEAEGAADGDGSGGAAAEQRQQRQMRERILGQAPDQAQPGAAEQQAAAQPQEPGQAPARAQQPRRQQPRQRPQRLRDSGASS